MTDKMDMQEFLGPIGQKPTEEQLRAAKRWYGALPRPQFDMLLLLLAEARNSTGSMVLVPRILVRETHQTLTMYKESHAAKGTPEGNEKALRNAVLAAKWSLFMEDGT